MNSSIPPLLPPPPPSSHPSSRSNTPRPPDRDLLSSSPPRIAEPLFPVTSNSSGNGGYTGVSQQDQGDTSFGSFTDATPITHGQVPFTSNSRSKTSKDPLSGGVHNDERGSGKKTGEYDLLGDFGDESVQVRSEGTYHGPSVSLLSGSRLIPTTLYPRADQQQQHLVDPTGLSLSRPTHGDVQGSSNVPLGQQDLLGEIDAFLQAERPDQDLPPTSSTSPSRPHPHPHPPPRRLSHFPTPSGASSPPAISPISSFSFRGKTGRTSSSSSDLNAVRGSDLIGFNSTPHSQSYSDAHSNSGGTTTTTTTTTEAFDAFDEFGAWASAGPAAASSSSSAGPSRPGTVGGSTWTHTSGEGQGEGQQGNSPSAGFRETMERMRRLSFDRERHPVDPSSSTPSGVNLGRKPSWLGRSGMVGSFPIKRKVSAGSSGEKEKGREKEKEKLGEVGGYSDTSAPTHGLTDEPGAYDDKTSTLPVPPHDDPHAQAGSSSTLLAEGTRRMTGLVHALGTLATKTASVKPKTKWRTVMGPSTFTPPTQGRSDPYFSSTVGGTSSGSGKPEHGASTWGRRSSGFMDDFTGSQEMDRPTPTAQPIEITHHTPFNLGSSANSHSVYIPGTNTIIHPTGSYMPAPPTGAPGFRNDHTGGWEFDRGQRRDDWGGTKLIGRREGTVQVLDDHAADALRPNLPARQRLSNTWTLLFSLDQHGGSLSTFYRLIEAYSTKHPHAGNLLIIKDENDRRFGVYMNEWIKRVEGTYTGSGESWLYKIVGDDLDARAKVFKWTGRNTYFALCESDFISFGGGDGKYGLWVDKVFQNGSSATSPAYANEVLCAQDGSTQEKARFDCMGLEVWATSG